LQEIDAQTKTPKKQTLIRGRPAPHYGIKRQRSKIWAVKMDSISIAMENKIAEQITFNRRVYNALRTDGEN
jgi:hypothetical protein